MDNIFKAVLMLGFALIASSSVTCDEATGVCGSVLSRASLDAGSLESFRTLCISTATCHVIMAVMYARGLCHKEASGFCQLYCGTNVLLACLWAVAAAATGRDARVALVGAGTASLLLCEGLARTPALRLPTRLPSHLATRMRKFQIVSITQVFAGMAQPRLNYSSSLFVFVGGALAQTLAMKVLFFDFEGVHRSDKGFVEPKWAAETVWVALHLVLSGTMTVFGSACSLAVRSSMGGRGEGVRSAKVLFCGATAVLVLCLTLLSLVLRGAAKGTRRWRKRWRVLIRAVAALAVASLPWWGEDLPIEALPWTVFAITAAVVVAELYGRAHRKHYEVASDPDREDLRDMAALTPASAAGYGTGEDAGGGGGGGVLPGSPPSGSRRRRASSVTSQASIYLFE